MLGLGEGMMSWVILRTAGRHTLRLSASLTEDGFEAWTPVETRTIHVARGNLKRKIELPIMPSYVFARASHLIDLIQLAAMKPVPRRNCQPFDRGDEWRPYHAEFSLMRCNEQIPVIADATLQGLRYVEAKRRPKERDLRQLAPGVSVRVKSDGGCYAGMTGKVERSKDGWTLVAINSGRTVKISTSLLAEDDIVSAVPRFGVAA